MLSVLVLYGCGKQGPSGVYKFDDPLVDVVDIRYVFDGDKVTFMNDATAKSGMWKFNGDIIVVKISEEGDGTRFEYDPDADVLSYENSSVKFIKMK